MCHLMTIQCTCFWYACFSWQGVVFQLLRKDFWTTLTLLLLLLFSNLGVVLSDDFLFISKKNIGNFPMKQKMSIIKPTFSHIIWEVREIETEDTQEPRTQQRIKAAVLEEVAMKNNMQKSHYICSVVFMVLAVSPLWRYVGVVWRRVREEVWFRHCLPYAFLKIYLLWQRYMNQKGAHLSICFYLLFSCVFAFF